MNPGTLDLPDGGLSVAGWQPASALRTLFWDNDGVAAANRSNAGPPDGGRGYFFGGSPCAEAYQDLPLAPALSAFPPGGAKVTLGGWFGGWRSQEDRAEAILRFFDADGGFVGLLVAGPVSAQERGFTSGLLQRESTAALPAQVRAATLEVRCSRDGPGPMNDGYFDELYVSLDALDGGEGPLHVVEPPREYACLQNSAPDAGAVGPPDAGTMSNDAGPPLEDAGSTTEAPPLQDAGSAAEDAGANTSPPSHYTVAFGCTQAPSAPVLGLALLFLGFRHSGTTARRRKSA